MNRKCAAKAVTVACARAQWIDRNWSRVKRWARKISKEPLGAGRFGLESLWSFSRYALKVYSKKILLPGKAIFALTRL